MPKHFGGADGRTLLPGEIRSPLGFLYLFLMISWRVPGLRMLRQDKYLYEFGPFRSDIGDRDLLRDGVIVGFTPKALDLIVAVVENCGDVPSKDVLMKEVWSDIFVEESNLPNHRFTLRIALVEERNGAECIETMPRRGYRFVAAVTSVGAEPDDLIIAERTDAHRHRAIRNVSCEFKSFPARASCRCSLQTDPLRSQGVAGR